jgi:ribose/xylose/arabinose/galactoside ABC-type transport system permease subunit
MEKRIKFPKINLGGLKKYTVMIILVILMILFSFSSPYFLTIRNITNIIIQNTYFIILAIGLSFVMIGGGIDLSVGWQMSLVGVTTAMCMTIFQLPVWLSVLIGIGVGTLLGLFNGLIIANIRVFPLIVTIATSTVFQGISYIISQAKTYRGYPDLFLWITKGKILGIPFDVILTLVIALLVSFIFSRTSFGWNVLALGGNEEAARLAGIKTKAMRIAVYAICGFFTAIATMVMISKANTTTDRCHRGRHQLYGRRGEHAGACYRRIHPGRDRQWHAAGRLGNLCPVHRKRDHLDQRGHI